jgi:hypothetical protein
MQLALFFHHFRRSAMKQALALALIFAMLSFPKLTNASDLVRIKVDFTTTSMEHCQVDLTQIEPAGTLTFMVRGKKLVKPIYSDLCSYSAQWIAELFVNSKKEIVGLGMGNTGTTYITVSDLWVRP